MAVLMHIPVNSQPEVTPLGSSRGVSSRKSGKSRLYQGLWMNMESNEDAPLSTSF